MNCISYSKTEVNKKGFKMSFLMKKAKMVSKTDLFNVCVCAIKSSHIYRHHISTCISLITYMYTYLTGICICSTLFRYVHTNEICCVHICMHILPESSLCKSVHTPIGCLKPLYTEPICQELAEN